MQPFLEREFKIWGLEHRLPLDASKAMADLERILNLAISAAPVNLTVNQFRELHMGRPYPLKKSDGTLDDRGNALISAPDAPDPSDVNPTQQEIADLFARLVENNQGGYKRGDFPALYPELMALVQG